jgi:hypothetical protein
MYKNQRRAWLVLSLRARGYMPKCLIKIGLEKERFSGIFGEGAKKIPKQRVKHHRVQEYFYHKKGLLSHFDLILEKDLTKKYIYPEK